MMRPALRVAALIIAAHGACVGPRTASEMAALFAAPYESVDRPTVALNRTDADPDPETVSLQLQVLKIRSIHEKDQTLVVHAFFRRSWSDPRLAWAAGDETPCVDEFDFPICRARRPRRRGGARGAPPPVVARPRRDALQGRARQAPHRPARGRRRLVHGGLRRIRLPRALPARLRLHGRGPRRRGRRRPPERRPPLGAAREPLRGRPAIRIP